MARVVSEGEDESGTGAGEHDRREDIRDVGRVQRRSAEQHEADGDEDHSRYQGRLRTEPFHQPCRRAEREGAHGDRPRQVGEPDLERAVAKKPLEIERPEEEHPKRPATARACITLAPETVQEVSIRSGIKDVATRA
jgi:hypothetical protein